MNNTTHTPGPWKAVQHPREHKWAWTIEGADGVGQSIARMGLVNDAQAVAANAHLIAAAPAMHRELETVREYLLKLYDQGNSEAGQYAASIDTTLAQSEGRG